MAVNGTESTVLRVCVVRITFHYGRVYGNLILALQMKHKLREQTIEMAPQIDPDDSHIAAQVSVCVPVPAGCALRILSTNCRHCWGCPENTLFIALIRNKNSIDRAYLSRLLLSLGFVTSLKTVATRIPHKTTRTKKVMRLKASLMDDFLQAIFLACQSVTSSHSYVTSEYLCRYIRLLSALGSRSWRASYLLK